MIGISGGSPDITFGAHLQENGILFPVVRFRDILATCQAVNQLVAAILNTLLRLRDHEIWRLA